MAAPPNAPAQSVDARGAREAAVRAVADSFYDAIRRQRYDEAASFLTLEPFEQYFREAARDARAAIPHFPTAEELMQSDSTMPRIVAEWQAARARQFASTEPFPSISGEFAGIRTPAELNALSLSQALARWLQAMNPRETVREAMRSSSCGDERTLAMLDSIWKEHVLGVTLVDDSTAYVILAAGGVPARASTFGAERIIPAHVSGGKWRLESRRDLFEMNGGTAGVWCDVRRK
jgi:hypothetical protein